MTRSLRVEFLPVDVLNEVPSDPQVHDVSIPDGVADVPEVLENPHVDFPGAWTLVGEGADGAYRYQRADRVASSSDTAAG
ncbi:hypothetical protein [Amnibacterium kyonggiense]|uniref:Uncharacterized protein n=1 Tax=Amnibacterium kyonggiense TaxID=595671 RepID=A0A4R7FPS3_9MICO|nr:hypothetical protein [Amnibacterium kyonggiense]TDS79638.1 hypothetical protein CLV52_0173 [Amnibacterium kyonggiense]